jgi:HipA-like C-terminal domain
MNFEETLDSTLRSGPASAAQLMQALDLSQSELSRALKVPQREGRVLKLGSTRGARYALPRPVAGAGASWPLFQVDAAGAIHELGVLNALQPRHYHCAADRPHLRGLTDAVPYFLQDQRPAGFLGRTVPASCPELTLPPRVADWSDDHYLNWLTHRGADCVGDLILGTVAFERYLQSLKTRRPVAAADRVSAYPALAIEAMTHGLPGSSAHGEHPKFTALVDHGDRRVQVIVKFSPPLDSPIGQRWADLLVAEHLALAHLNRNGIAAAASCVFPSAGRMFLEVERFDRAGQEGRVGVVSLLAVDAAHFGMLDSWSRAAMRLAKHGMVSQADATQMRLLEAFAMQIANTDRHFGNLALFDQYTGHHELAPVYDMLPMLFAPQDGQLIERNFEAPDPTAAGLAVWSRARDLAVEYWSLLMADTRISADFRQVCERSRHALQASPRRFA